MIKSASFHPMAEIEMNEAAEYYEVREPGLGNAFIDEVERAINSILQNPDSAQVILKSIRRKILWRFPYSLMYSINVDTIRVLSVASQKRRPFYWRYRK
jgi:toxin ParE1/3/4